MVWEVQVEVIFLCFWGVCFKIVFWSSWGRFLESIWGPFWHQNLVQIEKKQDWFWDRFSMPRLKKIRNYSWAEEALGDPSYACAFSTRKNEKARFQQLFLSLFKKKAQLSLSLFRLLLKLTFDYHYSDYCWIILIIVQIIVDFCLSLFKLLLNYNFQKLMLMIWHALGSGPANFLRLD